MRARIAWALVGFTTACGGAGETTGAGGSGATSVTVAESSSTTSVSTTSAATSSVTATASSSTGSGPCGADAEACCADGVCDPTLVCDGSTCGAPVKPFTCTGGSPAVVFVGEAAPPSTIAPWAHVSASVTFANCGSSTWSATAVDAPTGVKLGSATPHDSDTWAPSRIALPADVPPGNQITIPIAVHATPLTGPHAYSFELVEEGVAWLGSASPLHSVDVEAAPASPIDVCTGHAADPSGNTDATSAIQACLDATPVGGTLAMPPGIFRISGVLHVAKGMTWTTAGVNPPDPSCLGYDAPMCAVLRADASTLPSSEATRGFVRLGELGVEVSAVTLDHVLVDGNRDARLGATAAQNCAAGQNGDGINIGANCATCTVRGIASARAVCGSGLEWDGDAASITSSVFFGNGDHGTNNMWSDGLTIHKSDDAVVLQCRFVDNSDVGFISGGGVDAQYENNVAEQLTQASFAAIMLDNFNSAALGNHVGAVLSGNTVLCPAHCHFGIELGPHPWYASPNIEGGSVTNNTVFGANIEINAQGTGTVANPTVIANNTLGPTPGSAAFQCGNVGGLSPLNVSPESHVDLQGGTATGSISVPCP